MEAIPFWWDPTLQALLPEAALNSLSSQKQKLHSDWNLTCTTLPSVSYHDFEYNWFIVGTRTFYYTHPGSQGELDPNECLALVPIADYFNHADIGCTVNFSPDFYTFSTNQKIKKGEEISISYGQHSNDFLLAEYGFCLAVNKWDSICLDTILCPIFSEKYQGILRSAGYWGDYILDADSVCYRTEVALRLLCMPIEAWRESLDSIFEVREEIQSAADDLLLRVLRPHASVVREKADHVSLLDPRHERQKSILMDRWGQILQLVNSACARLELQRVGDESLP